VHRVSRAGTSFLLNGLQTDPYLVAEKFCHEPKNEVTDVKRNVTRNRKVQKDDANQERLSKDGESIGNNDGRQRALFSFFPHSTFQTISGRSDNFV
jgi:hypothetical protein